jgi:hypothetical protein
MFSIANSDKRHDVKVIIKKTQQKGGKIAVAKAGQMKE